LLSGILQRKQQIVHNICTDINNIDGKGCEELSIENVVSLASPVIKDPSHHISFEKVHIPKIKKACLEQQSQLTPKCLLTKKEIIRQNIKKCQICEKKFIFQIFYFRLHQN